MKVCTKCKEEKLPSEFYKKRESADGLHPHCKSCRNEYRMSRPRSKNYRQSNLAYYYRNKEKWAAIKSRRRAAKLNATVSWADDEAIDFVYYCRDLLNSLGGDWEVDHIVPLQNNLVCGLHTELNLQLLRQCENRAKGNRFVCG